MADVAGAVIGAVACLTQCLCTPEGHRIHSLCDIKRNFEVLKQEVEKLNAARMKIQRNVDMVQRNGDNITEDVLNWLKNAKKLEESFQMWTEQASEIIRDDQEAGAIRNDQGTAAAGEIGGDAEIAAATGEIRGDAEIAAATGEIRADVEIAAATTGEIRADEEKTVAKKRCFKGLCPNLKRRYLLSTKAVTLLKDVAKLLREKEFDKISYPADLKDPRLSHKDYEDFESRTSIRKNVISSLIDPNVNIVGIYGMVGIGKTVLVREVVKKLEESKRFDRVIFVEVKENSNKVGIQNEIAESLHLELLSPDSEAGRTKQLYERLANESRVLLIFDNVWFGLDLSAIGIPLGVGNDACKVLLTSRSFRVLVSMNCQNHFRVELLDDEEAWQLFKKKSRVEGIELVSGARDVAKKCARLPDLIVTVAKALTRNDSSLWRSTSEHIDLSSSADRQLLRDRIKTNFNNLENNDLKEIFLLIGYANITSIDELLIYGMSLGLFKVGDKMQGRRDRVCTWVQHLKDSSLLLDSNTTGEDFSIHDVVHQVALSIVSEDHKVFTTLLSDLESLNENPLKDRRSIILKDARTDELTEVLECQQLQLLSLSGVRPYSSKLCDMFFRKMIELKVLVLDHVDLLSLPSSLCSLSNLRALGLYDCRRLENIAIIGDLKKLEILSLKDSDIEQLPKEVGRLTRLKSLDLRGALRLGVIAPNVLSGLSQLEELYMGDFSGWEEARLDKAKENASLNELTGLSELTCLEIKIRDANTLPEDLFFKKLKRYKIEIGQNMRKLHKPGIEIPKSCRIFNLSLINTNICLKGGHIMHLEKIQDLILNGLQDMKSVLYGLDTHGFQQLKYLQVIDNDNLLYIVDKTKDPTGNAFPVLESLVIHNLINLKKICHDQPTTVSSFSQLRKIEVKGCNKLKNIFSFSIARRLKLLQSVDISDCKNLQEIFANEREDGDISEVIDNIEFKQLRSLCLKSLPQLKSLGYSSDRFNTLFSGKVILPILEVLIVEHCNNLKCLLSSSMIAKFDRLQFLKIYKCPALEIMVIDEKNGLSVEERENNVARTVEKIVFPRLSSLTLRYLPKFATFFSRSCTTECPASFVVGKFFPNLERLTVQGKSISTILELPKDCICKIRYFEINFDESVAISSLDFLQRFDKIKRLKIQGGNWECLGENGENERSAEIEISNLNKCSDLMHILKESNMNHLIHLEVKNCYNLDNLLVPSSTSFQNLTTLEVDYCRALTNIVTSSTAKSMGHLLRQMKISHCNMITEIMAADERDEIVFRALKKLHLERLQSLTSFCSTNCTLKFLSLEVVTVIECPKMKSFSGENLRTPKLQTVKYLKNNLVVEECCKGNLNTIIQQLHGEMETQGSKTTIQQLHEEMETQGSKQDSGQSSMQ